MNNQSEQINELAKALSSFQGELEGVEKDSVNPYFKSKYADLHAVWQAIRKPLAKYGLSITQIGIYENDKPFLSTILMHSSGQWIRSVMPIITAKSDIQSFGGSMTYCKRYALQAIVGCSSYDDDGEEAMKEVRKPAKKETTATLDELCKGLMEFDKDDIVEYIRYICVASKMSEGEVIEKTLSADESFRSFREKLKARLDKKKSAE